MASNKYKKTSRSTHDQNSGPIWSEWSEWAPDDQYRRWCRYRYDSAGKKYEYGYASYTGTESQGNSQDTSYQEAEEERHDSGRRGRSEQTQQAGEGRKRAPSIDPEKPRGPGPDPPPPPPKKNASYATQHQPEDAAQYRTSYSDHTDTQKQSMRSVEYNALTPRASVHNMSVGQDTRSQSIGGASASQYEYSEDNVQNLSREKFHITVTGKKTSVIAVAGNTMDNFVSTDFVKDYAKKLKWKKSESKNARQYISRSGKVHKTKTRISTSIQHENVSLEPMDFYVVSGLEHEFVLGQGTAAKLQPPDSRAQQSSSPSPSDSGYDSSASKQASLQPFSIPMRSVGNIMASANDSPSPYNGQSSYSNSPPYSTTSNSSATSASLYNPRIEQPTSHLSRTSSMTADQYSHAEQYPSTGDNYSLAAQYPQYDVDEDSSHTPRPRSSFDDNTRHAGYSQPPNEDVCNSADIYTRAE